MTSPEKTVVIDDIVRHIKRKIKRSKKPWVSWGELERDAKEIVGSARHPSEKLWSIMEPFVFNLLEDVPRSKNPRLYELKLGQTYIYYPVEMTDEL